MSQSWQSYRSAPSPGTRLVKEEELLPNSTLSLTLENEKGRFPLLLIKLESTLVAYVNACPHQYLPLDQRGKRILSQDGEILRCTNHEASFSTRTGEGVGGHGLGCALDAVPVSVEEDGWVVIANPA
ncbi:Rieske 2Fe-2S domain-containing protein [Vreelandella rituensis]|uniref:Rieske (2Fe-2S) protein n=1 Tax=Vreelandella rituensis TaxID=2282306 RepID=A0A368TVZ1_9GAMM|nr:Rieske (2Fe-2S) protein [Halomonas rituensis]